MAQKAKVIHTVMMVLPQMRHKRLSLVTWFSVRPDHMGTFVKMEEKKTELLFGSRFIELKEITRLLLGGKNETHTFMVKRFNCDLC